LNMAHDGKTVEGGIKNFTRGREKIGRGSLGNWPIGKGRRRPVTVGNQVGDDRGENCQVPNKKQQEIFAKSQGKKGEGGWWEGGGWEQTGRRWGDLLRFAP